MSCTGGAGGAGSVAGAVRAPIASAADAEEVTRRAAAARACEATAMNATSSRSHSVLTLHVAGLHEGAGTRLSGSLHLVDLAGRHVKLSSRITVYKITINAFDKLYVNQPIFMIGG